MFCIIIFSYDLKSPLIKGKVHRPRLSPSVTSFLIFLLLYFLLTIIYFFFPTKLSAFPYIGSSLSHSILHHALHIPVFPTCWKSVHKDFCPHSAQDSIHFFVETSSSFPPPLLAFPLCHCPDILLPAPDILLHSVNIFPFTSHTVALCSASLPSFFNLLIFLLLLQCKKSLTCPMKTRKNLLDPICFPVIAPYSSPFTHSMNVVFTIKAWCSSVTCPAVCLLILVLSGHRCHHSA